MNPTYSPIAIAVVCVDWRMHHPDSNFMKRLYEHLDTKKIYTISYPGPDGLCEGMNHQNDRVAVEAIVKATRSVLEEHGATKVQKVIVSHSECAGHQCSDDEHREHGKLLVDLVNKELGFENPFISLMAVKGDDDFDWHIS